MRHHIRSLQLRFMIVVIAGATIFAAVFAALAYGLANQRTLESGRATIVALVDTMEKTAAIGAYASDAVLLKEVVDGLARNPLVGDVSVRLTDGVVLIERRGADDAQATRRGSPAAVDEVTVERRLVSPFDATETVGTLSIAADLTRMRANARSEAITSAALIVGQTALVAMLLYAAAARLVSQPIVQLGRQVRRVRPGSAERLTMPHGHAHDEIGALVTSANTLLDAVDTTLQRERELRAMVEAMEAQYRQIFDASSAGIFVVDARGRLVNSNPTALKIIGLPIEQMRVGQGDDFIRKVFVDAERVQQMVRDAEARSTTVSADLELVPHDDAKRWVHCLISAQIAPEGQGAGAMTEGVIFDITERKRAEGVVSHEAEHDALTGLKNRRATEAALDRFIANALLTGGSVTVLYLDLDGFKGINDTLGHEAGDQVLRAVARRLLAAVRRTSDVVGRLGGDEFVIALDHIDSADTLPGEIASALLASLLAPIELRGGGRCHLGASIGMAAFPRHGSDRLQLMQSADVAMYEVKRHGKNSFAMAAAVAPRMAPPSPGPSSRW